MSNTGAVLLDGKLYGSNQTVNVAKEKGIEMETLYHLGNKTVNVCYTLTSFDLLFNFLNCQLRYLMNYCSLPYLAFLNKPDTVNHSNLLFNYPSFDFCDSFVIMSLWATFLSWFRNTWVRFSQLLKF